MGPRPGEWPKVTKFPPEITTMKKNYTNKFTEHITILHDGYCNFPVTFGIAAVLEFL